MPVGLCELPSLNDATYISINTCAYGMHSAINGSRWTSSCQQQSSSRSPVIQRASGPKLRPLVSGLVLAQYTCWPAAAVAWRWDSNSSSCGMPTIMVLRSHLCTICMPGSWLSCQHAHTMCTCYCKAATFTMLVHSAHPFYTSHLSCCAPEIFFTVCHCTQSWHTRLTHC